jgi:signal transduction histidine kinase
MSRFRQLPPEAREAYDRHTFEGNIRNSKVACILVVILMPIGYLMDTYVYPVEKHYLLALRLMTSLLAGLVFLALRQRNLPQSAYRILCAGWYLAPGFFISWMIYATEGIHSTYYAGLNLVILAISTVIQATLAESMIAIGLIVSMYFVACVLHGNAGDPRMIANNGFFLFCTSAIVLTGNFFYNRLRCREYVLRFELDQNRQMLEDSNQKLKELDQIKGRFFANISHEL